jgi:membrane protease YdiL (CAAX protease family)
VAWVAIGIAFVDSYGVARGWTASSRQPHPVGYDFFGIAWWFFALKSVVIVPFCEEAVARGFLYRAFRGSYGPSLTTVFIICFSAYFHWGSVSRSVFTFACLASLWALLCILRERTGSLWNCLLCHAVYNSVGIHLRFSTVIAMFLLLLFFMRPTISMWRSVSTKSTDRDA